MDEKAACQKHESAIQDKTGADTKDVAGDLSRSCWDKPENKIMILGSPLSETNQNNHYTAQELKGGGDKDGAAKLGLPDTKIDYKAEAADTHGNKPQDRTLVPPEEAKPGDGTSSANATDGKNPHPDTWKYDDKGNLLQAGDRLKAEYDDKGNLQKVQVDDMTYERKGKDVVETTVGKDGKLYSYVNRDVDSFSLKASDKNFNGASKDIDIKTEGKSGTWSMSKPIWDSPEKQAFDQKLLKDQHQGSIDGANSTPDQPHPDTWKRDKNMNVIEAGNKFKAEYNPSTGELMSARLGDEEWKRGPDNTILHSYKKRDGSTISDVMEDVRSFTAKPYSNTNNGLLAGINVEVETGKSGSSGQKKPIYKK
ncbi:MAG: hypothetical protein IPJ49_24145 [Candidatus Obscuribacter sp.]|jgi:hypothetical protein|nr:hypothetical protein [Candidatus Obscuribacter sp.]